MKRIRKKRKRKKRKRKEEDEEGVEKEDGWKRRKRGGRERVVQSSP